MEAELASALWRMVVEYGGNDKITAINPHMRDAQHDAIEALEEAGYWYRDEAGQPHGFNPPGTKCHRCGKVDHV